MSQRLHELRTSIETAYDRRINGSLPYALLSTAGLVAAYLNLDKGANLGFFSNFDINTSELLFSGLVANAILTPVVGAYIDIRNKLLPAVKYDREQREPDDKLWMFKGRNIMNASLTTFTNYLINISPIILSLRIGQVFHNSLTPAMEPQPSQPYIQPPSILPEGLDWKV